jgi:hypothetical protein
MHNPGHAGVAGGISWTSRNFAVTCEPARCSLPVPVQEHNHSLLVHAASGQPLLTIGGYSFACWQVR